MPATTGFLSLLFLLGCMAPTPTTAIDAVPRAALKGSTVTLFCPRPLPGQKSVDETIQWLKGRDVIFEDDGMVMGEKWTSEKFDLSVDSPSDHNLTINAISMDDKDSYVCRLFDLMTDEITKLAEFDVVVLEEPKCLVSGGGSSKLVRGQSYDFTCLSEVNDVTLLWSVGTMEKNIGENIIGLEDTDATYKTTKTLVADASLQGESVECELQHPAWSVEKGVLKCSVGEISVENAVEISCDEDKQKDDVVVCLVKANDEAANPLSASEIKWVVQGQDPKTAQPVDASMIEPLADDAGFVVTLTSDQKGEMHAVVVGEEVGPWQKMPLARDGGGDDGGDAEDRDDKKKPGSITGIVVVIVVIVIILVAVIVVVVLWKRKIIFSASKSKDADVDEEKGAPKLNGVTYNNGTEDKTLLTSKVDSQVDDEKKEERRSSNASSEDDKKLFIDSDSGKTKASDDGI